jgi:hypothetical protein
MDVRTARIQALRANIRRCSRLLDIQLTEDEREFIHTLIAEGRLALEGLYAVPPFEMSPSGQLTPSPFQPAGA